MSNHYPKTAAGNERVYRIWSKMRERCSNPRCHGFKNYGGRGIAVCAAWSSFPAFLAWALGNGYAANLTIERRDGAGPYGPENCTWATSTEQNQNRRNVAINSAGIAFCEIARQHSISQTTFHNRIARGWSLEDASTLATGHPAGTRVRTITLSEDGKVHTA